MPAKIVFFIEKIFRALFFALLKKCFNFRDLVVLLTAKRTSPPLSRAFGGQSRRAKIPFSDAPFFTYWQNPETEALSLFSNQKNKTALYGLFFGFK